MTATILHTGRDAPKSERSAMQTRLLNVKEIGAWRVPPFQRPVTINSKVKALAEELKNDGGCLDGVITLGKVKGDQAVYVVDGLHRLEGFRISGLEEFIGDVRLIVFDTMADMAEEFVRLNTALVRMRPDDILRGLESSVKALHKIINECKFVGYDQIRRGTASPIVGMSQTLKCWSASTMETPSNTSVSAALIAQALDEEQCEDLIVFLTVAHEAWGRDAEYYRLWNNLNLALCMWLWRRMVKNTDRVGNKRYSILTIRQFKTCLMGLSADPDYCEWLTRRTLNDRDRSPAYSRIKKIWAARLKTDGKLLKFPSPSWTSYK